MRGLWIENWEFRYNFVGLGGVVVAMAIGREEVKEWPYHWAGAKKRPVRYRVFSPSFLSRVFPDYNSLTPTGL